MYLDGMTLNFKQKKIMHATRVARQWLAHSQGANRGVIPLPAALMAAAETIRNRVLCCWPCAGVTCAHNPAAGSPLTAREQRLDALQLKEFLFSRYGPVAPACPVCFSLLNVPPT